MTIIITHFDGYYYTSCTDSMERQRDGEEEAQMTDQYSRWGWTSET